MAGFERDPYKEAQLRGQYGLLFEESPEGLISKTDPNFKPRMDPYAEALKALQVQSLKQTVAEKDRDAQEKAKGAKLPSELTSQLGQANFAQKAVEEQLQNIEGASDIAGPGTGAFYGLLGKAQIGEGGKKAAEIDALANQNAQVIGRFLEGGKMTDADVPRYKSMMPSITDSPEVRKAKAEALSKKIAERQSAELEALGGAGYNVQGIPRAQQEKLAAQANAQSAKPQAQLDDQKRKRLEELRAKKAGK
jgi:hypothetical protein